MKSRILYTAGFALALCAPLPAQSIVGTWQGTLPTAQNSRVVVKIEKSPDGSLHGGLTRIDSGADGLPLTSVTFAASDIAFDSIFGGVSFKGKLSPDGRSIEGTWTQLKETFPLTLAPATPETAWKREGPGVIPPMSPTADPSFEVAIIKPSRPDEGNVQFNLLARKFTANWCSAKELIKIAYYVRGKQVPGGDNWLVDDKFDVVGEPDTPGIPSEQQTRNMVRKLLEDRFHLVAHMGRQVFPALSVTVDKNIDTNRAAFHPADPEFNGHGTYFARMTPDGNIVFQYSSVTVKQFIGLVMNIYQANLLVDDSGLTGVYDITLTVPASELMAPPPPPPGGPGAAPPPPPMDPDAQGNALISAAKRIGFHFTPRKEPLPIVVIDHIDHPTPN